jgi:inosose dehydratase
MEVDLARKDQMESAFKVISVSGFEAIEITDSALGGHIIPAYFGTARNFLAFLNSCGVGCVCSYFTGLDHASPTNSDDHGRMVESAGRTAAVLAELGGSCLVVRPLGPYWREAPITDDKIKTIGECWSQVGAAARSAGVKTAMHVDFLCGVRKQEDIEKLLMWTDPETVGLALDTADLAIAGIDPVKFYEKHHSRINHLHFKDALVTDALEEYKETNAEMDYWPAPLILAGTKREMDRWYYEMGSPGGLVDFPALLNSVKEHGYQGWIVVESDQSPHVEESVMLNGWYKKQVLDRTPAVAK